MNPVKIRNLSNGNFLFCLESMSWSSYVKLKKKTEKRHIKFLPLSIFFSYSTKSQVTFSVVTLSFRNVGGG